MDLQKYRPPADPSGDRIRVFVGTDNNQMLGFKVLAHSLQKHASRPVDAIPMVDMPLPVPAAPENRSRTGFTFTRYVIPELCDYKGRAIYLDADMLVFKDIAELWRWPMADLVKILSCAAPEGVDRPPQFSVMVLDCGKLTWDIRAIVKELDQGRIDYPALVYRMALEPKDAMVASLPATWNDLERYDAAETGLIHYTDMHTQPWVYGHNRHGAVWYAAAREALDDGFIAIEEIADAINKGHVSPQMPQWLERDIPGIHVETENWVPPYQRLNAGMQGLAGNRAGRALRQYLLTSPRLSRLARGLYRYVKRAS